MRSAFLSTVFAIMAPCLLAETNETYGIFDCVFLESGDSRTLPGFSDAISGTSNWTAEHKSSIQRSLNTWMNLLNNTAGRQLSVLFAWSDLPPRVLGGSSSGYYLNASDPGWDSSIYVSPAEAVWQLGVNWNAGGQFDIVIQFSTAFISQFYFGAEQPSPLSIDFESVMLHELGHNLGFFSVSTALTTTTGGWPFVDNDNKPLYTSFDLLMTQNGQEMSAANPFELGSTINIGDNLGLTVYNPEPWEEGSSMSHIDPASDPDALMNPVIGYNTVKRTPTVRELQLMEQMGWNINWAAVHIPEPTSGTLALLAGSILILRRNRRKPAAA